MTREDVLNLVQRFASGAFETATFQEEIRYADDLSDNLMSLDDIIPMLRSPFESAQLRACRIASESASDAKKIFQFVAPLIHSPFASVRNIVCICYLYCANSDDQIAELTKCLEDTERTVRLSAMWALTHVDTDLIAGAVEVLRNTEELKYAESISKFLLSPTPKLGLNIISMRKLTRFEKYCYYIMAIRCGLRWETSIPFLLILGEKDLIAARIT